MKVLIPPLSTAGPMLCRVATERSRRDPGAYKYVVCQSIFLSQHNHTMPYCSSTFHGKKSRGDVGRVVDAKADRDYDSDAGDDVNGETPELHEAQDVDLENWSRSWTVRLTLKLIKEKIHNGQ